VTNIIINKQREKENKKKLVTFSMLSILEIPVEKPHQNPYPRLEGRGLVRVQILLPRPLPQRTLPVTPAGF
jgi:hypothetical protein